MPYYISDHFKSECINNEGKFFDDAKSMNDLFFTDSYKRIACRPFIYLFKGGVIVYGIHGEWHAMADARARLFRLKRDGLSWFLHYDDGLESSFPQGMIEDLMLKTVRIIGLFKEFAETKEKTLPPKGKVKEFHCRYKSDFDFKIGLLTENWYTESCQTHPFVVRGHWRWQRHGEKLSKRKLIWIDPFMKNGYIKGAFKDAKK